ncbi:lysine--tRNA ligase [Nanoarchaeota archaeon]
MKKPKKLEFYHWADQAADNVIKLKGNKKQYVMAAGITPSGTIHMGNFREIITQELVKRALESRGKKVRFIYSWDDYDVFRKVPKNMPKQAELKKQLRKSISDIPDPFGCHKTYAEHNEAEVEEDVPKVGVETEFMRQSLVYRAGTYDKEIKQALEKTAVIKEIMDKYRKEPLADDWLPIAMFCPKCGKDTIKSLKWLGDYEIEYDCECGSHEKTSFKGKGFVKLLWRIDWPMRWHYYNEDFESAGKDHFAAGGSVSTAREIQKQVWGTEPPLGFPYEWISIKGGKQFASSAGVVITLKEMLEIYQPEIIRYLFASTRPNAEFSISFDVDVIKIYEDFDRCERIHYGVDEISDKEREKQKRIYELSSVSEIPKKMPLQWSFRHLTTVLQIHELDIEATIGYYEKEMKNKEDKERLQTRATCVKNWLEKYAPDDFKFSVQDKVQVKLGAKEKKAMKELAKKLEERDWTDVDLHSEFYIIAKNFDVEPKDFFKSAYLVLINKEKGPRLASFILQIGKKKAVKLLDKV